MKILPILISIFWISVVSAEPISETFLSEKDKIKKRDFRSLGKLEEKYILKFRHLEKGCGTDKEYFDLVTIGYLIEGTHTLEFYSEVASKAIMLCPDNVLKVLRTHHGEPVANFVRTLVIRIPPWEVAEAIYPELLKNEHQLIYEEYFKKWVHTCVNNKGKAIVGCGN